MQRVRYQAAQPSPMQIPAATCWSDTNQGIGRARPTTMGGRHPRYGEKLVNPSTSVATPTKSVCQNFNTVT